MKYKGRPDSSAGRTAGAYKGPGDRNEGAVQASGLCGVDGTVTAGAPAGSRYLSLHSRFPIPLLPNTASTSGEPGIGEETRHTRHCHQRIGEETRHTRHCHQGIGEETRHTRHCHQRIGEETRHTRHCHQGIGEETRHTRCCAPAPSGGEGEDWAVTLLCYAKGARQPVYH
ncbi:hypothetical protein TREES_T100013850 [Tupaia chinensis]|uniref:Uncharacterized protein n=1 Tax=Tupaia chinensis TaxID=246437 RepID=L9KYR3_TUPCH|nr:hypothetical protein TREES_T100013850 [Tupaia chinensis]